MKYNKIDVNKLTYEIAIKRLEEITKYLSNEGTELEKALDLYKEGLELSHYCETKLTSVEKELKKVKLVDEQDNVEDFDVL
ncbi:MAG: exodeoxyribonuclease VII small subunit [Mycoplasma sp.]